MIISDVCNTLFDSNTTFDYIKFVLEKENKQRKLKKVKAFEKKYHPFSLLSYGLNRFFDYDFAKELAVKQLKGFSKETLANYATLFYDTVLEEKKIATVFQEIKSLNDNSLVLASASIEPIIVEVSKRLNAIAYASSTLEYKNNFSTGKIKNEAKGRKFELLKEKISLDKGFTFISDNFSDKTIMAKSKNPIAVVYNKKADLYWKEVDCKLIKMY